jgi:hypothetical protein
MARPVRFASVLAGALLFAACSDPKYGDDAQRAEQADAGDGGLTPLLTTDASTREDAARLDANVTESENANARGVTDDASTQQVPAWAAPLRGSFAMRKYVFRQDSYGTITRGEEISLAEFVSSEAGLRLTTKLCRYAATTKLAEIHMADPSQVTERSENVSFSATEQRWSTDGAPFTIGFTREAPAICAGKVGELVTKPAAQVWTSATTCRCAEPEEEPLLDDCRVLDPDRDLQPGFTYELIGTAFPGAAEVYGVSESNSHLSNGQLRADGSLHANVRADETSYQLGCMPAGCSNIAVLGQWCPVTQNSAELVPLSEDAPSCASVLAQLAALFPTPAPAPPERCFQQ